jgi:hypothetical protein
MNMHSPPPPPQLSVYIATALLIFTVIVCEKHVAHHLMIALNVEDVIFGGGGGGSCIYNTIFKFVISLYSCYLKGHSNSLALLREFTAMLFFSLYSLIHEDTVDICTY